MKKEREEVHLDREKRSETNKGRQRLENGTVSGVLITVISNLLNRTTLSTDEFRDNLRLIFRLKPQGLRQTCNRCRGKLTVDHALQ